MPRFFSVRLVLAATAAFTLTACVVPLGNLDASTPVGVQPDASASGAPATGTNGPAVRQITIEPANPTLAIGEKTKLVATVQLDNGTITSNVVWSSSDDTVATVNATTGEIFALKVGRVTIEGIYALDNKFKGVANVNIVAEKGAKVPTPQSSTIIFGPGGTNPTNPTNPNPGNLGGPVNPGNPGASVEPLAPGLTGRYVSQASGANEFLAAIDMVDARTGYAGGNNGLLLRTTDGGASWETISPGTLVGQHITDLHFSDAQNGLILAGSKIYRTTDGANTVSELTLTDRPINTLRFQDAQTGYLTTSAVMGDLRNVYFRTLDGGNNWVKVETAGVSFIAELVRVGDTDVIRAQDGIYLFDSNLGGYDKRQVAGWSGRGQYGLAYDGANVWLWDGTQLMRSRDNGANWVNLGAPKGPDSQPLRNFGGVEDLVAISAQQLYLFTSNGVVATLDGAQTWNLIAGFTDTGRNSGQAIDFIDAANAWFVGDAGSITRFVLN